MAVWSLYCQDNEWLKSCFLRARFGLWCDFASLVVVYITYFNFLAKVP
jgi:hypothetical protein